MPVSFRQLSFAGAPTQGVDEVQTITPSGTISGGTFTLTYGGDTTAAIDFDATAAEVAAALNALDALGSGEVTGSGGPVNTDPVDITFSGRTSGGLGVSEMTVDDALLTGSTPALAISTATAGVRGTYRGAQVGAVLQDTTNGRLYENTGSAQTPAWTEFNP